MSRETPSEASPGAGFAEYVAARSQALGRVAYLLTGDHHLAEDLVQTTLFKAARSWHRIEGQPDAYVRRILHREHLTAVRRRRVPEVPLEHTVPAGGDDSADHDLRMSLRSALAGLTAKQRAVLVLRYFEDLTEPQTAAVLGVGLGTVKSTTRQALARLRTGAPHLAEHLGLDPVVAPTRRGGFASADRDAGGGGAL